MTAKEYQDWVRRLSQYEPCSEGYNEEYRHMIRAGVNRDDRLSIHEVARKRYEERRRSLKGHEVTSVWIDEYTPLCGASLTEREHDPIDLRPGRMTYGIKFNTEGEKQMEKIDWHKPLWALNSVGEPQNMEVKTYKSGKQRVVWIEDRVYPVDDQGRAMAEVWHVGDRDTWPRVGALKGAKLVENVPEEKFFVGLYRHLGTSNYFLEDGGVMKTRDQVKLAEYPNQWIVDTRKSAEPPKAIEHDPEDYVVVYYGEEDKSAVCSDRLLTQARAKALCGSADMIVRVRTTPAPVDTSRYIILWRIGPDQPWRINKFGDGRQEFTWAEVGYRVGRPDAYCIVKVRD